MIGINSGLFAQLESKEGYQKTRENDVLNKYVNFHKHENTQTLHDYLVSESIQMRGVEAYYIRRELVNVDMLFGEDLQNQFKNAYKIAIYINSFDSYEGQREVFSKFGFSVQDEISFSINPTLFRQQADGDEAREGDLLYFPMDNSLFELSWVEPREPFFQVGNNSIRKITATKFVYSGENIDVEVVPLGNVDFDVSQLELEPVTALDGKRNNTIDDEMEQYQVENETDDFVKPHVVINGMGDNREERPVFKDPFDDL